MDNTPIECKLTKIYEQKHHYLLPSPSVRGLIIGPSGCGKTNLLLRLLLQKDWLDYNKLYIYSKSLHQPEYKVLIKCFELGYSKCDILNIFRKENIDTFINSLKKKKEQRITINQFDDYSEIPDPTEIDNTEHNLFVFDDVMTDVNKNKTEDYYTRGRHNNISSIYISQNYFKLPRQTIRSNTNVLILFNLSIKDLRHIYDDHCSNDMEWYEFNKLFTDKPPFSYVVINNEFPASSGKYQVNFNSIYIPSKYIS